MVKQGYLCVPIDRILKCSTVEEAVLEACEEWMWGYLYKSSKLFSPKHKITQIISHIKQSRLKRGKSFLTKNEKVA